MSYDIASVLPPAKVFKTPSAPPSSKLSIVTGLLMDKQNSIGQSPVLGTNSLIRKFQVFGMGEEKAVLTDAELRKYIFRQERPRHIVDALRVPSFTRQSFVHSFLVGLVFGCSVALLLKILFVVLQRMF